jgi:phosphoglycerate dehydrogenase-like enzyme
VNDEVVLLPWPDHADVLAGATDGLAVEVYEGDVEPAPEVLGRVTFYVPPYMAADHTIELMSRMPSLQVVQTLTAGVDNVWAHLPDGVALHNAAGVHDASTAELVLGLILASLRRIDDFARAQQQGQWLHGRYDALADKTVLLLGYGHVGEAIEARLAGFETDVLRVARTARRTDSGEPVHGFADLPDLLPRADVVVLVVPQTAQTTGMVDAKFLRQMRDGSLLVNAARGPVVVTADLLAEVAVGRLRAALDVTDPEPLPADHKILTLPNVIVTCHTSANSDESYVDCQSHAAREVVGVLSGRGPTTQIKDPWLLAEAQDEGFGGV